MKSIIDLIKQDDNINCTFKKALLNIENDLTNKG